MDSAFSYKVRAIVSVLACIVSGIAWFFFPIGTAYSYGSLGGIFIFALLASSNFNIYERKKR